MAQSMPRRLFTLASLASLLTELKKGFSALRTKVKQRDGFRGPHVASLYRVQSLQFARMAFAGNLSYCLTVTHGQASSRTKGR